jgi:hypothetical protein
MVTIMSFVVWLPDANDLEERIAYVCVVGGS